MDLDKGIKFISLTFVTFMHYVLTGLVFFVPIDVAHYVWGVPQFPAILMGSMVLWIWAMVTAWIILKTLEKKDE